MQSTQPKSQEELLNAFFKACKKNGVSVSTTPNSRYRAEHVIIGVNGERYRITSGMRKILEKSKKSISTACISVQQPTSQGKAKFVYKLMGEKVLRRNAMWKKGSARKPVSETD